MIKRLTQPSDQPGHAAGCEILYTGKLRGTQKRQPALLIVGDQGIFQFAVAVNDVKRVENDIVLKSKECILSAKADVCIKNAHMSAGGGKRDPETCAQGGFAHTAFSGHHKMDCTHAYASIQAPSESMHVVREPGNCRSGDHSPWCAGSPDPDTIR